MIAHASEVFVADKLSITNKKQLNSRNVQWVELRSQNGYQRFTTVLKNLKIPYKDFSGNIDERLPQIFKEIFR